MHSHSRRAEQRLAPSSTCTAGEQSKGSLHPAQPQLGEQSKGSLHPAQPQPESRAKARSIQHSHSRRVEQRLAPSSTATAGEQSKGSLHPAQPQLGEQSKGSLHPAHAQPESRAKAPSIQHMHSRRAEQRLYMCIHNARLGT